MTSRPTTDLPAAGPVGGPVGGPGDRPHLPPVAGSTSRRTDRKTPLAWLPWVLLGLLLLTLLVAALLTRAADGSDSTDAAAPGADTAANAGSNGAGNPPAGGSLTAGGQDLLALQDGRLGTLKGQPAEGAAKVESVVADEGFWVGSGPNDRVFVFLTPEARRTAGESGFQVEAGQTVSLTGTVKASSAEFAQSVGLSEGEGAARLVEQGGYVAATSVKLAG